MILDRENVLKYKICLECIEKNERSNDIIISCAGCIHKEIADMRASDLCETLENQYEQNEKLIDALENTMNITANSLTTDQWYELENILRETKGNRDG